MKRLLVVVGLAACGGGTSPPCGDGVVDNGEQCDDGNDVDGDGCSAVCAVEVGTCGNGIIDAGEACDDGNIVDHDGCSAVCAVEVTGLITADWSFEDLTPPAVTGCPAGFTTAAVTATPDVGTPIIDLFDCAEGTGTAEYPVDIYTVNLAITTGSGGSVYATTPAKLLDIRTADGSYANTIFNDAGYFGLAWTLRGAVSNNDLTCAQAGAVNVTVDATGAGNALFSDMFPCTDGLELTIPFPAGSYTVSIGAIDGGGGAVGIASALAGKVITAPNGITPLGTVIIPIDGM